MLALLVGFSVNCEWCAEESAKAATRAHRERLATAYVFDMSEARLVGLLREEIEADGLVIEKPFGVGLEGATSAVDILGGTERHLFSLSRVRSGLKLHVTREEKQEGKDGSSRLIRTPDGTFQWRLIQRVDPQKAAQIEAAAAKKGEEAYQSCLRCGRAIERALEPPREGPERPAS